jgi:hypothetical protein
MLDADIAAGAEVRICMGKLQITSTKLQINPKSQFLIPWLL